MPKQGNWKNQIFVINPNSIGYTLGLSIVSKFRSDL